MCLSIAHGGYRCPCSGGIQPPITTPEERAERAAQLDKKRDANARAADKYRRNQALMAAEARAFVSRLPRDVTARRAALVTALADLPERGAIAPRRVLEEALSTAPPAPPTPSSTPAPKPTEPKESKALTKTRERLELARAAGASPESIAIIERRIAKLTPKNRRKPEGEPVRPTDTPTPAASPSPAVSPVPASPAPDTPPVPPPGPTWTPESARSAVEQIVQGEFDKGRSAAEIQSQVWQRMSTLSPSKDRVLFGALQAAMRELEAYR